MEKERTKEKVTRRTICMLCFAPMLMVAVLVVAWRPILFGYSFTFVKMVVSHILNDKQKFLDNQLVFAQMEWRLYQMETRFGQDWCKENVASRSDVTWLTVMVNDEYVIPALSLGHSIRTNSILASKT